MIGLKRRSYSRCAFSMSSFNRMQISLFARPSRTCSGRSILISCIETLATRFARRCNSCSSGERRLTSNSSSNSGSEATAAAVGSINSSGSDSGCRSNLLTAGFGSAGFAETGEDLGTGCGGCGRCVALGGSAATLPTNSVICASSGERGPVCMETVTNRERTSREALREAAEVCARRRKGSALVGLLLAHAETTSLTAWCSSSEARWMRSRLSRSARAMACSTALGSCDISIGGCFARNPPSLHFGSYVLWSQPPEGTAVPNRCLTATARTALRASGTCVLKQLYRKSECSAKSLRSGRHRTLALEQDAQGIEHGLCALVDGHISGIPHSVLSVQIDLGAVIIVRTEMQRLRSRSSLVADGEKPSARAAVRFPPKRIKHPARAGLCGQIPSVGNLHGIPLQNSSAAFLIVELDDVG